MLNKTDIGVGLYLLFAVIFFIIPIPSFVLDLMLAVNLSIALIILFNVLFVKEILDMSFFPTLLLFTTIFRISLNVSSTRLILTTGEPGNVVQTFGNFVGGGNLVIGAIVFIVLVIIQFVVINKRSERVADVTARFTLDAMPGKQMAIDADLNTGAITDKEAKERREKIQHESNFFGAMDGATKYVKGDATAGLIITFINLIGGPIMGVMYQGKLVEVASTDELFSNPCHPYTRALLSAIPYPDPIRERNRKRIDFDEMEFDREGTMQEVAPGHLVLRKEDAV